MPAWIARVHASPTGMTLFAEAPAAAWSYASLNVARHRLDRLARPGALPRISLVGPRPGRHQVQLHLRIARAQEVRHLPGGGHQLCRIARLVTVQRAVAVHHDHVPASAADDAQLVLEMKVEADTAARFERDVVVEARLLRERLEEGRDAANPFIVEIGHRVRPVEADRRSGPEREAVADEQHARARRGAGRSKCQDEAGGHSRCVPHDLRLL